MIEYKELKVKWVALESNHLAESSFRRLETKLIGLPAMAGFSIDLDGQEFCLRSMIH